MTAFSSKKVFTPVEVAQVLRVTSETIRRKIVSGELGAIEVGGGKRKQYRITLSDLSQWLGPERSTQLFGADMGLQALGEALAGADERYLDEELPQIIRAVRQERAAAPDETYLPTPTSEEIARKFGQS